REQPQRAPLARPKAAPSVSPRAISWRPSNAAPAPDTAMTHPTALPALATLDALDRAHLVHPVSPWRTHEQRGPTVLSSGRGAGLTDGNGRELLDAFAGLWCVNVGYGQESVVQAAAEQMRRLPYATGYFHFSSEPAIRLADKLVQITPASLTRVYLTLG